MFSPPTGALNPNHEFETMSDAIACPVCDTYNPADAIHCEVCGERLTAPEPGEELAPEENVAAMIASTESEAEAELESGHSDAFVEPDLENAHATEASDDEALSDAAPDVLYSPLDGRAYERGSDEYEEGFGPMGEELVAQKPDVEAPGSEAEVEASVAEADEAGGFGGFEDEFASEADAEEGSPADADISADATPEVSSDSDRSAEFQAAFRKRERERPDMKPLEAPGTLAEPAKLTLYVNREPVSHHLIETDEVLIGRRDPVADAYPDFDLTDFDPDGIVSRKHVYVYRQNKNYTLYAVSNAGTQLNSDLLELGDRKPLSDGDVIVLSGRFALKFELPE